MATIKVFDTNGVKVLNCFDTLDNVPYFVQEEENIEEPIERDPFED